MPFPRAKPIDDLYAEVADHELVVVPDAPLASALNRRLDQPHLGVFATTPRRLAAGRREEAEDRLAFIELVEQTNLDWKRAAYAIGNILQCWEHQGSIDAILTYDAYVDDATRQAVRHMRRLDTTSKGLTDYRIDADRDLAVIGESQFTQLERSILPVEYDSYELFDETSFDRPRFHIYDSATGIVDTVVDTITAETADDVAVVLDAGSEFSTLIEAALEDANLPFYGGPGFIDEPNHRGFIQLLRAAHAGTDTRIREVRPLFPTLNLDVEIDHDEKRLYEVDHSDLDWMTEFCATIEEMTLGEALTEFELAAGCDLGTFREELDTLGMEETPATAEVVDQLVFYLQTYEVPVYRENEGVLLADAKSAAYVDRPLVFYLGIDEGWTHNAPRRPWVDQDAQYTRNLKQFQRLLQSGTTQYYLVQDASGGSPVTPCLYFEELLETEFDRFSDLESTWHTRRDPPTNEGFDRDLTSIDPETMTTISQSSLSTYVNSPRDYLFSELVDGPDKDYFTEGNLFHDFAEFYLNHPEFVEDDVLGEVVEYMLSETRSLVRPVEEPTRKTRYRGGTETIRTYFESNPPGEVPGVTPTTDWGENEFATLFDRTVDETLTERWFENEPLGIEGKIDLIHSASRLVDHKSSTRKTVSQVVKNAAIDPPSDTPDFQALQYLTHWRSQYPDQPLEFTFFHFLEPLDDVVTSPDDIDLEETLTTVLYRPRSFVSHIRSEAFFTELVESGANNCQKTLSKIEYADYEAVFNEADPPATGENDEFIKSDFGQALQERLYSIVGYKYARSGAKQALRAMASTYGQTFYQEDLDAYEEFVADQLTELNARRAGTERFPVEGLGGEPNYRRVNHRDLILEGDR